MCDDPAYERFLIERRAYLNLCDKAEDPCNPEKDPFIKSIVDQILEAYDKNYQIEQTKRLNNLIFAIGANQ
jgi:hypothetical protein